MLRRIQRQLERFYAIERSYDVVDFVREVDDIDREVLLVRENVEEDLFEMALLLPGRLMEADSPRSDDVDGLLQALEGVSHFVYLTERVRAGLPTTLLELELQAEVDKFVLLAIEGAVLDARGGSSVNGSLNACDSWMRRAVSAASDIG